MLVLLLLLLPLLLTLRQGWQCQKKVVQRAVIEKSKEQNTENIEKREKGLQ